GLKPSWEFGQQQPAIIVGGKEMDFSNFIYTKDDDDLVFLPKEPSPRFDSGESLKAGVFIVHPGSVAARIKERKCKTRGGSTRPHVKRKLASGSSSSRVVCAKNSASKDDAPFLPISNDDKGLPDFFELKDASSCHLKIAAITPPAWKGHLDNQMDLELLDLHDRSDVIKARERSCKEECKGLQAKCKAAMAEFDQNTVVLALWEKISSLSAKVTSFEADKARLEAVKESLRGEIEELRQDRRDVVLKVMPYTAMELVHSNELGRLVGKLVSSAITYGRCRAYEQVVAMKEPFDLSKVKGYRSLYQKEHTQASNDFATATFLWLDKFVADVVASIKALLSKKPPILQKHAPSRTLMLAPSSQKATPSSAPSVNPITPPANLSKPSPPPLELRDAIPPFVVCLVVIPSRPKSDPHITESFYSEDLDLTPLCAFISKGSCVALRGLSCQMKGFDLLHYVLKAKRSNEES
ncbi:hypothetical protein Tco_1076831, partial [Tanacetum coccineum]